MFSLESVLGCLLEHRYLAMFGAILLSAVGLPVPEEVTLIASGLAVGWDKADFALAALACMAGILASDAFNFAMGRYCGKWFLSRRAVQWVLTPRRQARVARMFERHGSAAVFLSRFVPVMRLGVHAWAGQHGFGWGRFLLLDAIGAAISGPATILAGAYAARQIADAQRAAQAAEAIVATGSAWIWAAIAAAAAMTGLSWLRQRRRAAAAGAGEGPGCTST